MTSSEVVTFIVAIVSILSSLFVSIYSVKYFNNRGVIYEVKKNAILRSLRLLDDYMSSAEWSDKTIKPIMKMDLTTEYLTIEARECYNELIVTCKNSEIIKCFNKIVFSNMFSSDYLQEFREKCREELGLKEIDLKEQTTFINYVGLNINKKKQN